MKIIGTVVRIALFVASGYGSARLLCAYLNGEEWALLLRMLAFGCGLIYTISLNQLLTVEGLREVSGLRAKQERKISATVREARRKLHFRVGFGVAATIALFCLSVFVNRYSDAPPPVPLLAIGLTLILFEFVLLPLSLKDRISLEQLKVDLHVRAKAGEKKEEALRILRSGDDRGAA